MVKLAKNKVVINIPHNWTSDKLSEAIKTLIFEINKDNEAKAQFVVPVYANTNEAQVTPTKFAYLNNINAAGSAPIWTPAAGKHFRLLGGIITLSKDAACAGAFTIGLTENTIIMRFDISSAALVATGNVIVIPFAFPANGYLCAITGQALNIQPSAILTAGYVSIVVWGTEE